MQNNREAQSDKKVYKGKRTTELLTYEVALVALVCGRMFFEYKHGAGVDGLITGIPMLIILAGMWIAHNQLVDKLCEMIPDLTDFKRLTLLGFRIEMCVMFAVFFGMGYGKWLISNQLW
jgi:hypothetical protein